MVHGIFIYGKVKLNVLRIYIYIPSVDVIHL